jgi:hypothetical protein
LLQIIAYHIDLTTLADGTYELIPEPDEGISEAQVNVTKGLSEASNPGTEDTNITDPRFPSEGKPGALPSILNYALILLYIYLVH